MTSIEMMQEGRRKEFLPKTYWMRLSRVLIVLPHVIFLLFASRGFLLFCPIRWPRSTLFMNPRMKTGLVALPPEALV
jgi:hypothetical protein